MVAFVAAGAERTDACWHWWVRARRSSLVAPSAGPARHALRCTPSRTRALGRWSPSPAPEPRAGERGRTHPRIDRRAPHKRLANNAAAPRTLSSPALHAFCPHLRRRELGKQRRRRARGALEAARGDRHSAHRTRRAGRSRTGACERTRCDAANGEHS
jgi:hypothetical protein